MTENILNLFSLVQKKSIQLHKTGTVGGQIFWRSIKDTKITESYRLYFENMWRIAKR
jgi:hypothetical protein